MLHGRDDHHHGRDYGGNSMLRYGSSDCRLNDDDDEGLDVVGSRPDSPINLTDPGVSSDQDGVSGQYQWLYYS